MTPTLSQMMTALQNLNIVQYVNTGQPSYSACIQTTDTHTFMFTVHATTPSSNQIQLSFRILQSSIDEAVNHPVWVDQLYSHEIIMDCASRA
jgi:hypothetical protein